jgi:hypothetical protein
MSFPLCNRDGRTQAISPSPAISFVFEGIRELLQGVGAGPTARHLLSRAHGRKGRRELGGKGAGAGSTPHCTGTRRRRSLWRGIGGAWRAEEAMQCGEEAPSPELWPSPNLGYSVNLEGTLPLHRACERAGEVVTGVRLGEALRRC